MNINILQDALLEIYLVFRGICERHGIRYCASFGTALGAVRHGGFIPWDDDLDIEMLRSEYDKFRHIARKELPPWLRLMSWDNTYSYGNLFPKIICTDAERVASIEARAGIRLTQGLFIDLFIVDRFPHGKLHQWLRIIHRCLVRARYYSLLDSNNRLTAKHFAIRTVGWMVGVLDGNLNSYYDAVKRDAAIVAACQREASTKVWMSCWISDDLKVARGVYGMTEDDYINAKNVPFGPASIPVVNNVEEYLGQLYGDWKQLPREDQRTPSHGNKAEMQQWRLGMAGISKRPILSIVIANYNYGRFIDDAILSVVEQTCGVARGEKGQHVLMLNNGECVELIVCDAGSTDDSIDIIEKYSDCFAWWCSEPDGGQSDAFNKGFSHASGRYLTWLNSDDVLVMGSLMRFCRAVSAHPDCQWFAGGCIWMDAELKVVSVHRARNFSKYVASCGTVPVYSPSSFFTKELLGSVGGVNPDYHFKMDRLLWSQFYYDKGEQYRKLKGFYFGLRMHPDAKVSGVEYYGKDKDGEDTPALRRNREEREAIAKVYPRKAIKRWPQLFARDSYLKVVDMLETIFLRGRRYMDVRMRFR